MTWLLYLTLWTCSLSVLCYAASKDQPHGHQGVLKPYNGKQLNQKVTKEQEKKLENGESIMINKRDGKTGMGMCIADINSPPNICKCVTLLTYLMTRMLYSNLSNTSLFLSVYN